MHKLINKNYSKLLEIFSPEFPEFILPFLEAKSIQRLANIGQHCGTEYNRFFNYKGFLSRLDHSVGVALIIWNFTKDKRQTLSGLFHDISHSVFSHVGDYILGDAKNQESSEQYTTEILKNDEIIMKELKKIGFRVEDIDDYEIFPIADNPGPQLAADRLEYTLSGGYELSNIGFEDIKKIYENIVILKNEKNIIELGFTDESIAYKFGELSIINDEGCFSSYESVISMSFLSDILKKLVKEKIINYKDLYILDDKKVIEIMENTDDKEIYNMWKFYKNIYTYKIDRYRKPKKYYCVSSDTKKRYIDPLIKTKSGNIRLSSYSEKFNDKKNYHLNRKQEWISLDYKM